MRRYIPNENGVFYYDCECNPNTCLHIALIDWDRLSPLTIHNTTNLPNVPVKIR